MSEKRELKCKENASWERERFVYVSSAFLVLIVWSVGSLKCFYIKYSMKAELYILYNY